MKFFGPRENMFAKRQFRMKASSKEPAMAKKAGPSSENLRPIVIAAMFLLFFLSASGVFLTLPLARMGHVDFRHQYTAGYMKSTTLPRMKNFKMSWWDPLQALCRSTTWLMKR
jgi:hypothetical protein